MTDGGEGAQRSLEQIAAILAGSPSAALPDGLILQVLVLEREPLPAAADPLARLFLRLPVVAEARRPIPGTLAGVGRVYDPETSLALATVRAWVACVAPEDVPDGLAFLRAATVELLEVILGIAPQLGLGGAMLAVALALDDALIDAVRERAIAVLSSLAHEAGTIGHLARDTLASLKTDRSVGGVAGAALARIGEG
ncbi:MAG: hypothetical protein EXR72_18065 [Myxococcales bacterium]|nr:hypothetical protein [Myxococcales bacterium]